MTKEKRQRVRFTGKRTGLEAIPITGLGVVHKGDVIEVSEEEAERWTAELPMGDDKFGSDFTNVGGVYSLEEGEVAERRVLQQQKHAVDAEDVLPAEVNTEPAHESADTGTVEEQADEIRVDLPHLADDDDKSKRGKKS